MTLTKLTSSSKNKFITNFSHISFKKTIPLIGKPLRNNMPKSLIQNRNPQTIQNQAKVLLQKFTNGDRMYHPQKQIYGLKTLTKNFIFLRKIHLLKLIKHTKKHIFNISTFNQVHLCRKIRFTQSITNLNFSKSKPLRAVYINNQNASLLNSDSHAFTGVISPSFLAKKPSLKNYTVKKLNTSDFLTKNVSKSSFFNYRYLRSVESSNLSTYIFNYNLNSPKSDLITRFDTYLKFNNNCNNFFENKLSSFNPYCWVTGFFKKPPFYKSLRVLSTNFKNKNYFNTSIFQTFFKKNTFLTNLTIFNPPLQNLDNAVSRIHTPLTLAYTGLFSLKNLNLYSQVMTYCSNLSFKLRKQYYSFLKPNQVKSALLKRRASLILYKVIQPNQSYKSLLPSVLLKLSKVSVQIKKSIWYRPHQTFSSVSIFKNLNQGTKTEVKISRVRFKPGYQRLWRDARLALKELIGVRFIYQKQLTKYLVRFYKKTMTSSGLSNELNFSKLVLYSRIVPDVSSLNLFFNSNFFFLNGLKPTSIKMYCVINDFIQLIISKWYYAFYRWVLNWNILRLRKVKRLIYLKGLAGRHRVMKSRKQRSTTIPDWIFTSKYDFSDVKPFIEVDYFTLSFFVIYEPYTTYYYSPTKLLTPTTSIYRLYNWKYIT